MKETEQIFGFWGDELWGGGGRNVLQIVTSEVTEQIANPFAEGKPVTQR